MKKKNITCRYTLAILTVVLIFANGCKKDGDGEQTPITNTLVITTSASSDISTTFATT